jgi:CHAT domain-containing protein
MTDADAMAEGPLTEADLAALASMETAAAREWLVARGRWDEETVIRLSGIALERADGALEASSAWLALADDLAGDLARPPAVMGPLAYAQARVAVQQGRLGEAETHLRTAQSAWQTIGDAPASARSYLGLTQVLAMQGRYAEATVATDAAIAGLLPLTTTVPDAWLYLARGRRNRATLMVYQERHAAALADYAAARAALASYAQLSGSAAASVVAAETGQVALNEASAYTFLDNPTAAAAALGEAIRLFTEVDDRVNRGRARTNRGRLLLRLGDYTAALTEFDQASADLIPALPEGDDVEALRQADELLLEHATAYVALNLLPEAEQALVRCERLFRASGQPYELAQTRYTQGLLWVRRGDVAAARNALTEAETLFAGLQNRYWSNLCRLALMRLAAMQGDTGAAMAEANALALALESADATRAVVWDVAGLADLWLLRAQLALAANRIEVADQAVARLAALVGDAEPSPLPHLYLRLVHARGQVAAARGDRAAARRHFAHAVDLLDDQRAGLPIEEVRTAFLDDKVAIYADLVLSLLDSPTPDADEVAAAFLAVERARSRALLERLMLSVEPGDTLEPTEIAERRAELRRQLHWLYNRLLGESGTRRLDGALTRELLAQEAAIRQLEWRVAPAQAQAAPVALADLQASLEDDQRALLYFIAGDELIAFVVSRDTAHVARAVARLGDVRDALAELRFQMGRVELGPDYLARHRARLAAGLQSALGRLYDLVVRPLRPLLDRERLLIAPYGPLHLLPFHALWDGERYLVQDYEISYAPSASVAVHCAARRSRTAYLSFAGLAPHDPRIPQAQAEVTAAATFFANATTLLGDDATQAGLRRVAAGADVLHLATHGLFRPDNSFFSALMLADGWLDVREVYRLRPAARLVVLSACESGVGEVRGGDEVIGLARGFLVAGADTLVASLWNVHDASAVRLMECFYDTLTQATRGDGPTRPATALRAAQMAALDGGQHAYFWAPFFTIG